MDRSGQIIKDSLNALEKQGILTEHISIEKTNDTLVLKGKVISEEQKKLAGKTAGAMPGVNEVINELEIEKDSGLAHAISVAAAEIQKSVSGENNPESK